jgi:hypothetical protein
LRSFLFFPSFFTSVLHARLAHVDLPIVDRAVEAVLPVAVQIPVLLVQVHLLVHTPVLLPYDAEEETPVVEENPAAADAGCTPVVDLVVADSDDVVVGVDIDYYGANLVAVFAVVAIVLPHHYYWTEADVVDDDLEVVLPDVVLPDVVVYHVEKRVGGSCYSMVVVVVVVVVVEVVVRAVDRLLPSLYYLEASS